MATRKRTSRKQAHSQLLKKHRQFYELMLEDQGGGCAICGRPPSASRKLDMDHDHKEMFVRGLLCHRCNRWLASWVTVAILRNALAYLMKGPVPYTPEED